MPKIPSYRITDVATAVAPSCKHEVIGIRPGEKLHEEMITVTDALRCAEFPTHYVILPSTELWDVEKFLDAQGGALVGESFHYDSGNNTEWLTVDDLRSLIRTHVDATFEPM